MRLCEEVFRMHGRGTVRWPEPMLFALRDPARSTAYRVKAAELEEIPVVGVRVTGYRLDASGAGSGDADNTRFVVLSDPATGRPLALIDEHWTYNARTSASAVVSVRHLAAAGPHVVALVGAGTLADTCLRMLALCLDVATVRVYSRRPESREGFARRLGQDTGLPVTAVASPEEAVTGASIVVTATSAQKVLVHDAWIGTGATVVALGRGELEPEFYGRVDKIVVDDWQVVLESNDIQRLLADGVITPQSVYAPMADVVAGDKGRTDPSDRILIRSDGLVSQDVAICYHVYQAALREGVGVVHAVG